MNGRYLTVGGEIRQEMAELERVVERTIRIWGRVQSEQDDDLIDAAALNLHGFYSGVERIFTAVADKIDQAMPSSSGWHKQLLRQMSAEIANVRPGVIRSDTRDRLDEFRAFRHVVRNVYTFNFDPARVGALIDLLGPTMEAMRAYLNNFVRFLEEAGR